MGTRLLLMAFTSFCPPANDALLFAIAAHHEAVDVLQENDRQPVLIAVHDEAGRLFPEPSQKNDVTELDRPQAGRT